MTEPKTEITQLVINIPEPDSDGFAIFELLKRMWGRKFWIIVPTIIATLTAVFIVLFILPKLFISKAVIQLVDSQYKTRIPVMSMGNGVIFSGDYKNSEDYDQIIANYLDSWTFKEKLIRDYNMMQSFYPDLWDPDQNTWKVKDPREMPNIQKEVLLGILDDLLSANWRNKSRLLMISYIDQSPDQARRVVGGILNELERYVAEYQKVEVTKYREFLEYQLDEIRRELNYWENQPSDEMVDSRQILSEIEALKMIYAACRYQMSIVRVEEKHQAPVFSVLDKPTFPLRVSPQRGRICAMTMVVVFFTATLLVFFHELTVMISKKRSQ